MKKFIVITLILAVTLFAAVWETVTLNATYSYIESRARTVMTLLEKENGSISQNEELAEQIGNLEKRWTDFSCAANYYCNHAVVKSVTEKVVMLSAYLKTDSKTDAYATACAIQALSKEMKNESLPLIGNLL